MNPAKRLDAPAAACMPLTDRPGGGTTIERRALCEQAGVTGTADTMKRGGFDQGTANFRSRAMGRRQRRAGDDR